MKQLTKFLMAAFALTAAISSCGTQTEDPVTQETLVLTADKTTIEANGVDAITFTVKKAENGEKVTDLVTISANGMDIEDTDNKFYTIEAGTYTIKARMGKQVSNELTVTATAEGGLVLTVDKAVVGVGETVKFTVTEGGVDVTKNVQVCSKSSGLCLMQDADGGYSTSFAVAGVYTYYSYYAEDDANPSNTIEIAVTDEQHPVKFQKAVAFFTRTGTWCPPCGAFKNALKQMINTYGDKLVIVNFYAEDTLTPLANNITQGLFTEMVNTANGRYQQDIEPGIASGALKPGTTIMGYVPTSVVDLSRAMIGGSSSTTGIMPYYNLFKDLDAKTGIELTSKITGNTVDVSVNVMAETDGQYGVGVFLLEDNVVYYQSNQGNKYNHTDVLRAKGAASIYGDDLGTITAGTAKNKTYSFNFEPKPVSGVPTMVRANLAVVAYTTYTNSNGDKVISNIVRVPAAVGYSGYKFEKSAASAE